MLPYVRAPHPLLQVSGRPGGSPGKPARREDAVHVHVSERSVALPFPTEWTGADLSLK